MQSVRVVAALAAVAAGVAAASCSGFSDRLTADVVAENLLVETTDPFGLGQRQAGVLVNLASITGPLNDPQASPVSGATVGMTIGTASTAINLPENEAGVYSAVSGSGGAPVFVYTSNARYAVEMVIPAGEFAGTYTTSVVAPRRTQVSGIPDPLANEFHPVQTDLTITITGDNFDRGLVVVFNEQGDILYDNRPHTPQEAVNFALGGFNGTVTIPGATFATPSTNYGVLVVGLKSAETADISTNLQILTRFYAGSGITAIMRTQ